MDFGFKGADGQNRVGQEIIETVEDFLRKALASYTQRKLLREWW
jgi:hypothetical protein